MSPNGRHKCAMCNAPLLCWGEGCPDCGAPGGVADGTREYTRDEIIQIATLLQQILNSGKLEDWHAEKARALGVWTP